MDDPRAAEGLEHLQRAARELVAAARSLLDVVEEVIDDDDRFEAAAGSVVELLGQGARHLAGVAEPIWVAAASRRDTEPAWASGASGTGSTDPDPRDPDGPDLDAPELDPTAPDASDSDPSDSERGTPVADLRARRSPGRVRRITVEGDVANP